VNTITWIYNEVGFNGLMDIFIMTLFLYALLVWFKSTRAGFVLTGMVIFSGIYLLSRQLNLVMTTSVFEKFFAVILITMIVIFQEDLRHFFEQIAVWSLNRRFRRQKTIFPSRREADVLARTVMDFAREKIGALIVLKGRDMIIRHLDGGESLNGEISEPLLKSIFDPHSIGHDGAVIIEGKCATKFSCHLPLSKNLKKIQSHGTRHAAALGLSELTDVLCLVVSEEQGSISIVRNGDIRQVKNPEELITALERFYQEINPQQARKSWRDFLKKNTREKFYSLAFSIALWIVFVYGAKTIYRTYSVPIAYARVPQPWVVESIEPKNVEVTLHGPRKAFYFISSDQFKLSLNLKQHKGEQMLKIHPEDFDFPKSTQLNNFEPKAVKVIMKKNNKNQ